MIAPLILGVWLASRVLGGTSGYKRWLAGAIALGVVPWMIWNMFRPPPFDITVFSDAVDYELASEEYADDFAQLNSKRRAAGDSADSSEPESEA